jgi:biopolymer transport protein ExbD
VKIHRTPGPHPVLILLAPAMGMALIVMCFLLLSRGYLIQPGVKVDMPASPFVFSPQRDPKIVSITAPPLSGIFFEKEKMDVTQLREAMRKIRGRSQTIIIKADKRALYENVSAVMNVALELGFPVVLATTEESDGL